MHKIKQENIVAIKVVHEHTVNPLAEYCPTCGERVVENAVSTKYVCASCRHFVGEADAYCGFCGAKFDSDIVTEHYSTGQLSDAEFNAISAVIEAKQKKE